MKWRSNHIFLRFNMQTHERDKVQKYILWRLAPPPPKKHVMNIPLLLRSELRPKVITISLFNHTSTWHIIISQNEE